MILKQNTIKPFLATAFILLIGIVVVAQSKEKVEQIIKDSKEPKKERKSASITQNP